MVREGGLSGKNGDLYHPCFQRACLDDHRATGIAASLIGSRRFCSREATAEQIMDVLEAAALIKPIVDGVRSAVGMAKALKALLKASTARPISIPSVPDW